MLKKNILPLLVKKKIEKEQFNNKHTLVQKKIFCTKKYSVSGQGLTISSQTIFGYTFRTISFDKMDEETVIGKTWNTDLLKTSVVILFIAVISLWSIKSFSNIWFLLLSGFSAVCFISAIFSYKTIVKEPELNILNYLPDNLEEPQVKKILQYLFETRNEYVHFKRLDMRDGTELRKKFAELIELFHSGLIKEDEFLAKKELLKSFSSSGIFAIENGRGKYHFYLN